MEKENQKYQTFLLDDTNYITELSPKYQRQKNYELKNPFIIKAFLPGKIMTIPVKEGQKIRMGETICSFDAMKMENYITSQVNARVKKIHITVGRVVTKNDLLFELEPLDESEIH